MRLIFIPLSAVNFSGEHIARFEGLDFKTKIQACLLANVVLSNLVLFAIMGEGPLTPLLETLHYSELGSVFLIVFIEMISTFILHMGRSRLESQAAAADNLVGSLSNSMGGLEIV